MSEASSEASSVSEIEAPQFCPWCGAPTPYRPEAHTPLWQRLADEKGTEAPDVMEDALHTDAYVTGCPGCRRVSHVVGHEAGARPGT